MGNCHAAPDEFNQKGISPASAPTKLTPTEELGAITQQLEMIEAVLDGLVRQEVEKSDTADRVRQLHGDTHAALYRLDGVHARQFMGESEVEKMRKRRKALVTRAEALLDRMEALTWANRAAVPCSPSDTNDSQYTMKGSFSIKCGDASSRPARKTFAYFTSGRSSLACADLQWERMSTEALSGPYACRKSAPDVLAFSAQVAV